MAKFLNLITKGRLKVARFGILYGVEGIGKTTFGSKYPNPVFVGPETSAGFDVARMPRPKDWPEFLDQLRDLQDPAYTYQSLVIDSLDWLEMLLFDHMKKAEKKTSVEDCGGGFGKWVGVAQRHWLDFLVLVDTLKYEKKMEILALAHYQIKVFNDPGTSAPYDRYQLKLNDKCAALLREAADFVLFANFRTSVVMKDQRATKGRGVSDGARIVYTEKRASHDAKNRFSLPEEMAFDYSTIMGKMDAAVDDILIGLAKDIEGLLLDIKDAEKLPAYRSYFEANKGNADTLKEIKNRLKVIVGEVIEEIA
jgi:hypothetical protein